MTNDKKVKFEVKIQNIVAYVDLGKKVSLEKVLAEIEDTEYQPEQFPGLIYRMQSPRASALIFSQGKIVCTGTKSIEDMRKAVEAIVDRLRKIGFKMPTKFNPSVENIVASSAITADLDLDRIAFDLENSEYEPEQFPGLVYRITQPRVAFLLFRSGKIIITGARTIEDVHEALGIFKKNLEGLGIKVTPVIGDMPPSQPSKKPVVDIKNPFKQRLAERAERARMRKNISKIVPKKTSKTIEKKAKRNAPVKKAKPKSKK